jgi:predicted PurR-regulated permease PerM
MTPGERVDDRNRPPATGHAAAAATAPSDPRTVRVSIDGRSVWQVIGAILLTVVLLRAASAASGLLAMVGLSFFFSLALDPAVRQLVDRFGWRRGAAVGVIYLAGVVFIVFMVYILVPAIAELANRIATNGDEWISQLNTFTQETFGFPIDEAIGQQITGAGEEADAFASDAFGRLAGIASSGIALVFNLATIAMFTFYFTANAGGVQRAVLRLFSPAAQQRIGWTWDTAIEQTGGYFYSRVILMGINGFGFLLTMVLVGMPVSLALPLAVFGGFVSVFIPAIGTYLGSAIPILLTLAVQGLAAALVVLGYALVYQQLENYWLSPRISAGTMSLNGGVAFGAALAGGAIAGPIGAFVALPVAALISAMISNYAASHEIAYRSPHEDDHDAGSQAPVARHPSEPAE